ncbi:MAG: UDP-N-acetylglucosamine--N-acetylmuramyl-(pentapeptide) pyrophosphoryl-undecaprenol N-acetylglucosamine transferase [Patescibacteria group bacterium]
MRIVFTGGGTLGSVTPLLALAEEIKKQGRHEFLWLGTATGPEHLLVEEWGIRFRAIQSGKLRRYFSRRNFFDPLRIVIGFFQSMVLLARFRAGVVLTAGSFAAVPVVFAAAVLRIPILVHQQDLRWGLANKLMRPFARWVTVNFEENLAQMPVRLRGRAHVVGNPVREAIRSVAENGGDRALKYAKFNLDPAMPVFLALGGGTGAVALNEIVAAAVPGLASFCQIVHLTGKEKRVKPPEGEWSRVYHWQEFLTKEMPDVYSLADVVLTRAGLGTLSELAFLGKAAIIVPMPGTHQEENARHFGEKGGAMVIDQGKLTPEILTKVVRELIMSEGARERLSAKMHKLANPNAAEEMANLVLHERRTLASSRNMR